nr:MAG TPA_asm: hypothetical protein [Bacteriophage sp.]
MNLVNSFGKADRKSYVNRAAAVTCISPLLHADCYPVDEVCFCVVGEFKMCKPRLSVQY